MAKLRVLNLAKNRITWLDPTSFLGLPALTELRLEGNVDLFLAGSLPVVLFTLTRSTHPHLKHLAIPQEFTDKGILEMCTNYPQTGSRIILRVIEHLNKNFCEEGSQEISDLETTETPSMDNSSTVSDLPENEGPVYFFIRRTQRWVLTSIAIGLLLTGVLISAFVFVCLYFGLRPPSPKTEEAPKTPTKPVVLPAQSILSLNHVYAPEGYCPAYFPLVRPLQADRRFSHVASNGAILRRNQDLARRRKASNSVYSLLSSPPNSTATVKAASAMNLHCAQPGVKQAVV